MNDHNKDIELAASNTKSEEVKNNEDIQIIKSTFKKYTRNDMDLRKSMDMSSVMQGKEFYEKVLKIDKVDRPVKNYKADIDNVENLNLKELERSFAKKGYILINIESIFTI